MFADVDLRRLAEMMAPERAFLSVYLAGPRSGPELEKRLQRVRRVLKGGGAERDEREHFDENVKAVQEYLEGNPLRCGSLCIFSCWAIDFFQAVPLAAPVKDLVWIDSSPYIRPLAELQEEYENVAVVVADNKKARIFLVSSAVAGSEEVVKGNVKNHVKKGGWSQQRYERRRDKQLLSYAREIVEALTKLDKEEQFRRILLVGSKEILRIVHDNLPQALQNKVAAKALDLGKAEGAINKDIMDLFFEQERRSEQDLWEKIRAEYLRGGLGVVGLDEVLSAARAGRVEEMIVNRTFKPEGRRCRECDNLDVGAVETCSACGSKSLFEIDVVNEIVEMLKLSGAEADFADPIESLAEAGQIAALLRY
ncbi:MAG: Vms1/Ankzf1 family peptidyl-tRNA hydrolase [bacterium]